MSDDLFMLVSKLVWFVAAPSTLIGLVLVAGFALQAFARRRPLGRRLIFVGAGAYLAASVLPIGDVMLGRLETRFPAFDACHDDPARFAGVIVLGGAISTGPRHGSAVDDLSDAADRIRHAAALARRFPPLPVLVSGGQVFPEPGVRAEADAIADLLVELGVARDRIVIEGRSRTTAENAARTAALAKGEAPWILVTSAYHMPRAVGTFRAQGVEVVAAPTDWRVDAGSPLIFSRAADRLDRLDLATKELLGLFAYRITGRTDALFPAPSAAICG